MLNTASKRGQGRPNPLTLLGDFYLELLLSHQTPAAKNTRACVKKYIFYAKIEAPADITADSVVKFISFLKGKGFSPRTLAHYATDLRKFCRFLMARGWLTYNPAEGIKVKVPPNPPPAYLDADQCRASLAWASAVHWYWPVKLALNTGMRKAELIHAKMADVAFDDKTIHVIGKGGKFRQVPLNDAMVGDLNALKGGGFSGYLVPGKNGNPMCMSTWESNLKKIQVHLPYISGYHVFRHTWATQLYRAGTPLELISKWLGHSSMQTTLDHYCNLGNAFNNQVNNFTME